MIIPIRCFTCGGLTGDKYELYKEGIKGISEDNEDEVNDRIMRDLWKKLDIKRYCCMKTLTTHVDLVPIMTNNRDNEYNYDNMK